MRLWREGYLTGNQRSASSRAVWASVLAPKFALDRACARHHHRAFRHNQRHVAFRAYHPFMHEVVKGHATRQHDACANHRATLHNRALKNARTAAYHRLVFHNHGERAHRFQHAANLAACAQVNPRPYLSARADQHMGIDHRALAHIGAHIHIGGRHHHHTRFEARPAPYCRASRHNPHALLKAEQARWVEVLI